ncbi:M20/M25/M40 family metallo-hydrolase [Spirosoma sp. KCTC 42546]|uniref:M20 family peptidase n=1 Tax=Spirosoma sp. KCTC 42546 TaxID=2520506 RepID=UPI001159E5E1|nr:M20 family peptidase [Spirosoma sp. KCTC 42546]QDK82682.1 M20/M25/M40 family metallo-hydrolase [Spirosoma sp. KCTC 42546]
MRSVLRIIGFSLVVLIIILLVNTFRLTSHQLMNVPPAAPINVSDSAIQRFAGAIRIPTVSYTDYSLTDTTQFDKFITYIRASYPLIHQRLNPQTFNQYGLLYEWKGRNPTLKPILLMGHYDVVPVIQGTQGMWKRPPFAGIIDDGYLYGRGTLDDKMGVMGLLEAVEYLLKTNFQPERTILLAFGQDEETSGQRGAQTIATALKQRGISLEYILDEGGAIKTEGVSGINKPVALISIAEKGYLSLELTAIGKGGHSSMPPAQTSIGMVAEAVSKLEHNPFPARLDGGADQLIDYLASEVPVEKRIVFANQWLFSPLIKKLIAETKSGNATLRTTTAPTIFRAGAKDNVLPIDAVATVNFRLLPGDTVEGVIGRVKEIIDNDSVTVSILGKGNNPAPLSSTENFAFQTIHKTIKSIFPDVIVAPNVMLGATDSKFYAALTSSIYKFSPMPMTEAQTAGVHGTNERIRVKDYRNAIWFYVTLIKNSQ